MEMDTLIFALRSALLGGAFCMFLFCAIQFLTHNFFKINGNQRLNQLVGLYLIINAEQALSYWVMLLVPYSPYWQHMVAIHCGLAVPSGIMVLMELFRYRDPSWSMWVKHVIPFVLVVMGGFVFPHLWINIIFITMIVLYMGYFTYRFVQAARTYNERLKEVYSDIDNRSFRRIMQILSLVLFITLVWFVSKIILPNIVWLHISHDVLSIVVWAMVISRVDQLGSREFMATQTDFREEQKATEAVKNSEMATDEALEDFRQCLNTLFHDKQLYLRSDLTRDELARAMHTNRTSLSELIRLATGMNFCDYVTSLRLKEAEQLLRTSDIDIQELSLRAGFGSYSSFYRVFYRQYKQTPREYREAIRKAEN